MKVRLLVLIILGIIVIIAGLLTVYYYRHGITDLYDEFIVRHSLMEDDPELKPVDPAIVKAIISIRTRFTARITGNEGEMGLMLLPKDGMERFKDFHDHKDFVLADAQNQKEFGLVCPNRIFPNHKKHREVFSRTVRSLCPVCQSRPIEAVFDAEINIRVGTWYLAYINAYLHENIENLSDEEALDFSLIIFENGLAQILTDLEAQLAESFKGKMKESESSVPEDVVLRYLKPYMETALKSERIIREIRNIKRLAEKFRPGLEKKARDMQIQLPFGKGVK